MWNPFIDMEKVHNAFIGEKELENTECVRRPITGIKETNNSILARIELPGIDKKDIELNLTEDSIEVMGEKSAEVKSDDCYSKCVTKFYRHFVLPTEVDPDKATAVYKDGVLKIEMPKVKEERKRIEIE